MAELDTSRDLFDDTPPQPNSEAPTDWVGVPIEELKTPTPCTYPSIRPANNHTILFKIPLKENGPPEPYPVSKTGMWDNFHVRMPHSPESLYPVSEAELKSRWALVKESLRKPIKTSTELEAAIFSYNSKTGQKWTFSALHEFFSNTLDTTETDYFFANVLPDIIKLALECGDKFRCGLPLLKKGYNRSISMSQEQASILLANAFLCTFPRRNSNVQSPFPGINFNKLFTCNDLINVQQKLKCFVNYFLRVSKKRPTGVITYTRRHIKPENLPIWSESNVQLCKFHVTSAGTIEDQGIGMMEVDFANKYVGGGVLGRGCVQEEIKFLICPELIVSRLFTECLDDTEALIVTGCQRFNKHMGYSDSFTWAGNYKHDKVQRDSYGRENTTVVAIDATYYTAQNDQYKPESINRELNKAYSGFSFGQEGNIATGNWGCGAFNGDPYLKALLQIMAASICKKGLAYFTFGECKLRDDIGKMYLFLKKRNVTIGILWQMLTNYSTATDLKQTLFEFIYATLSTMPDPVPKVSGCVDKSPKVPDLCLEPSNAETYSIKTENGKRLCISTEVQRWTACQTAMEKFSKSLNGSTKNGAVKRKITDYFAKK